MIYISESQMNLLRHIGAGGLVAIAVYGKKSITMEVLSRPFSMDAGLMRIDQLRETGYVREGDPSPYKSGKITPIVLTDLGKEALCTPLT